MTLADHDSPDFRIFRSRAGLHVLVVDGSQVYDLSEEQDLGAAGSDLLLAQVRQTVGAGVPRIDDRPLAPPPLASLSLNVAQSCNMSCSYCYADEGKFGGERRAMSAEVARASVDRLLAESRPGASVVVGFMGGEPLLNRAVVHETVGYATARAAAMDRRVRFSITTNATTLTDEDARLFIEHPFTVTVSVDGDRAQHDATRKLLRGTGSYDRMRDGLERLTRAGRPRRLAARMTIGAGQQELLSALRHVLALGFDEVGVAPVLVAPTAATALPDGASEFLAEMRACGAYALQELLAGRAFAFSNFTTALEEIHRGTHRPYPCGAGAGYLSVNATGQLYACHRVVDDKRFAMGDVHDGPDQQSRRRLLTERHVHRQPECGSCWARYLCGGGCYHEVTNRGRVGCDYIRGWLAFCLSAYAELSRYRPEYFVVPDPRDTTVRSTRSSRGGEAWPTT